MERKGLDWGSAQVQMLDLQYHDFARTRACTILLERQGRAERIVTDEEIKRRSHGPRGHAGVLPRRVPEAYGGAVFGVNWDSISFGVGDEPIKRILMAEPLKGTKAHVEELLASRRRRPIW